jgi:hypothetical protein
MKKKRMSKIQPEDHPLEGLHQEGLHQEAPRAAAPHPDPPVDLRLGHLLGHPVDPHLGHQLGSHLPKCSRIPKPNQNPNLNRSLNRRAKLKMNPNPLKKVQRNEVHLHEAHQDVEVLRHADRQVDVGPQLKNQNQLKLQRHPHLMLHLPV